MTGFEAAYRDHRRVCFALALRIVRDPQWAEDVTQEVFLDLWRRPERYDPARGTLRTLLLTITHHKSVDRVRWLQTHTGADTRLDRIELPDLQPGPELLAERSDRAHRLAAAMKTLPAIQRQPLALTYLGGYTMKSVADMLGWPLGTVKSRCRTGLRGLRNQLIFP